MGAKDIVGGGIFAALGIFILILTFQFPSLEGGHPGPSLFPRILAALFILFGGAVLGRGWKTSRRSAETPLPETPLPRDYLNPIFVLLLICTYMALSNWVGFFLTCSLVLFLMMARLRVPLLRNLVISILLTLFVDLMFARILRVPLPIGFFVW